MVKLEGEVAADGMVHIAAPDLLPGDRVTVILEKRLPEEGERSFGRLKGKIRLLEGFDDPIEGLSWAYD